MNETAEVIQLLNSVSEGSLATVDATGAPFSSAVGFIIRSKPGQSVPGIYILLSDLARHTKHLVANPKASLLVVEQNPKLPIHEKKRVTLSGSAACVQDPDLFSRLKEDYLKAFPKSAVFFTLPDFRFYEFQATEVYWIGGFGKATTTAW